MIDAKDKQTLPLIPEKRGRGRPKTGTAMTAAQKQKAYRERNKGNVTGTIVANLDENMALRQQLLDALEKIEALEEKCKSHRRTMVEQARMIQAYEEEKKTGNVTKKKRHRDEPAMPLTLWAVFGKKSSRANHWTRLTPEGEEFATEERAIKAIADAPSMGTNAVYTAMIVKLP